MHTYKSIYMYAYILCTNRIVVIFVVIVWKTTLSTLKKLKRNYLRRLFERTIWEGPFEGDHLERENGGEIFDKGGRNGILRQTARLLRISINKTRLFVHVWYLSPLNILSRSSLSNISLPSPPPLSNGPPKWSSSNGPSQMVPSNNSRKQSLLSFLSVFYVVFQTITTKITTNLFVHSIYAYIYIDLYVCIYMLNIYVYLC